MKKLLKFAMMFTFVFMLSFSLVACGNSNNDKDDDKNCSVAEKVELGKVTFNEVEFENAETVKLEQECDEVEIKGTIEAMTASQKSAYGVEDVTHVAVVKFTFDKERTLSSFEIKGNTIKVFATDSTVENYTGSLTDLLDNESGEDAYTYLVLSANTKNYELKAKYTDDTESVIKVEIEATLATASAE